MLRTRKRWISLLVTLAMLVAFCLPAGTAFAADPVKFSNATATGLSRNQDVSLGWIKGDLDQPLESGAKLYVTVQLPDGVKWKTNPQVNQPTYAVVYGLALPGDPSTVKAADDNSLTVEIPDSIGAGNFWVQFTNPQVIIDDTAAEDIKVSVTAKQIDSNGFTVWTQSGEFLVGSVGGAKVTVSAETPKLVSFKFFADRTGSKIVLTENVKDALSNGKTVTLRLPKNYKWAFSQTTFSGPYGLTLTLLSQTGDDGRNAVFSVSGSRVTADSVKITPVFQIKPGAAEADVVVSVTSDDPDFDNTDVTIAKFGAASVTLSAVNANNLATVYLGDTNVSVNNIKLKSDIALAVGDTVELTLPEGFEFAADPQVNTPTNGMKDITRYNENEKVYMAVYSSATEYVISNICIKAKSNAPVGPLAITVSGTAGAQGTVEVANVKARATAEASKVALKAGSLKGAAADIVITEAGKATFNDSGSTIKLTLPAGVKFADNIKYAVNDGSDQTVSVAGLTYAEFTPSGSSLSSAQIDKIIIKNIKYELDSRVIGDIEVKIGGSLLSQAANDDILKVVNATVVSPTAGKATMKIGDPTIVINGETKIMETAPYIKNQRTYVSVTYAALACGVAPENIMWDGVNRTVTVIKGDRIAQFKIGSKVMTLNGAVINMDTAPEIVNARTMMPVTWVALALGGNTAWDAATQTVTVTVN